MVEVLLRPFDGSAPGDTVESFHNPEGNQSNREDAVTALEKTDDRGLLAATG